MYRGSISNIGAPCVWIMWGVLFDENGLRPDRADWLKRAVLNVRVVVILRPTEIVPEIDLPLEYRVFRFIQDAQLALSRDPEPVVLLTESLDDLSKETLSFSENVLNRYNITFR